MSILKLVKSLLHGASPTMPSENWKNGVGSALLEYAQGTGDWDAVKTAFVDGWATEYAEMNSEEAEDATEADTEAATEAK